MNKRVLLNLAKPHLEHFSSTRQWNVYAQTHNLPSAKMYIDAFGSWNQAKKALGTQTTQPPRRYQDEEIRAIVKQHIEAFESVEHYRAYAKKHDLPDYRAILARCNWDEIQRLRLLKIGREHHAYFGTKVMWDAYAKDNHLPHSMSFIHYYGSWREAKDRVHAKKRRELRDIGRKHLDSFTSKKRWDEYAKTQGLPPASTFSHYFNSWEEAKREMKKNSRGK